MSEELKVCPFCGKQHKINKVAPVIDYDGKGKPILGEYKDVVSLEIHRRDTYIPTDVWQSRPLEDTLRKQLEIAEDKLDTIKDKLYEIDNWAKAYPLNIFPEPDWIKAKELLGSNLLTRISASNMRYVINGVKDIVAIALAEIEKGKS